METNQNNLAGSAVFWTLGEDTDYQRVSTAMQLAGFSKFTPERMTNAAALKLTLERAYPKHEVFAVRGSTKSFEVVRVTRETGTNKNEYHHVLTATVDEWNKIQSDSTDLATDSFLADAFAKHAGTVPYANLSRALVDIVHELGGTTLRPSGGIYWIPNAKFDKWQKLAEGIESSGIKNKVFALRTFLDEHSAAVLREALTMEIARESKEIDEIISDTSTSLKKANNAKNRAKALRNKIAASEDAFSMALPELKTALDTATGQEAVASLLDAASHIASTVAMTAGTFTAMTLWN